MRYLTFFFLIKSSKSGVCFRLTEHSIRASHIHSDEGPHEASAYHIGSTDLYNRLFLKKREDRKSVV